MTRSRLFIASALFGGLILTGCPAFAQHGGGAGGGQGAGQGVGTMQQDRDQLHTPDQDRDRTQDRDRDFTGDRDQDRDRDRLRDPDRDKLFLGDRDRLRIHDRDHDGAANRVEFEAWRGGLFDAANTTGAGLTLQQYHELRFGPGPYANTDPYRQAQMREQANLRKTERFRLMDGNGDGVVTRSEFMKFGEFSFLEADTNDDGRVSWTEMRQYNRGM